MYRKLLVSSAAVALGAFAAWPALAQGTVKIGVLEAMTGQQQSTGVQTLAAMRLYMAQHGDTVAGKKIELIVKDDAATADNSKRLAQELIVRDKVNFLVGFAVTPTALAVAPLATEAKILTIVANAGTSIITERSALHCAHERHPAAVLDDHRRMGAEERRQESGEHRVRRCARRRCREVL